MIVMTFEVMTGHNTRTDYVSNVLYSRSTFRVAPIPRRTSPASTLQTNPHIISSLQWLTSQQLFLLSYYH